jgi:hypothetical protein
MSKKVTQRANTWGPEDDYPGEDRPEYLNQGVKERALELTDPDALEDKKRALEYVKKRRRELEEQERKRQQTSNAISVSRSLEDYRIKGEQRAKQVAEEKRGEEAAAAPLDDFQDAKSVTPGNSFAHRALGLEQPSLTPGGKRRKTRRKRRKSRRKSQRVFNKYKGRPSPY